MSKHETWRTRKYWETVGGLLIEEFIAVPRSINQGTRLIDAVIVKGHPNKIHDDNFFDITGQDVICIQTKRNRLGMNLMGQAFFSRELLKKFSPKSITSVIICGKDDIILRDLCQQHNIEVILIQEIII